MLQGTQEIHYFHSIPFGLRDILSVNLIFCKINFPRGGMAQVELGRGFPYSSLRG